MEATFSHITVYYNPICCNSVDLFLSRVNVHLLEELMVIVSVVCVGYQLMEARGMLPMHFLFSSTQHSFT